MLSSRGAARKFCGDAGSVFFFFFFLLVFVSCCGLWLFVLAFSAASSFAPSPRPARMANSLFRWNEKRTMRKHTWRLYAQNRTHKDRRSRSHSGGRASIGEAARAATGPTII